MAQSIIKEGQNLNRIFSETVRWIIQICAVIAVALLLIWSFGERADITGHSMEPNFNPEEVVLLNRVAYIFGDVKRFDAVGFERDGVISVKRVVGLPGETIRISNASVYIDKEELMLPEYMKKYLVSGLAENDLFLSENEFFMLGDNGESSEDSRFESVGIVNRDEIIGYVWFRISPFSKLGIISE